MTGPQGAENVKDKYTAILAALADVTAAYHHERRHEGHWTKCQHPRCQNARLAIEGRGPFAALQEPTPNEQ